MKKEKKLRLKTKASLLCTFVGRTLNYTVDCIRWLSIATNYLPGTKLVVRIEFSHLIVVNEAVQTKAVQFKLQRIPFVDSLVSCE